MWGNRQGWIIAAVLAALILAPVGWIVRAARMSAPTGVGIDPDNLRVIQLPIEPDLVWPIATDAGDAGAIYRQVIDAWNDDAEAAAKSFTASPRGELPEAIKLLVSARHLRSITLFSADLNSVINYDSESPKLEKLFAAGEWCYRIGLSETQHGNAEEGTACLEAAFTLGVQLFNERIVFDECRKGMQLMTDAAAAERQNVERLSDEWNRLDRFVREVDDCQSRRLNPVWKTIGSVDPEVIARTAGDMAALATQSRERMWRVEATLKLGRFQYDAGSSGDQAGAKRLLKKLRNDPDPAVSQAAETALNLGIETYRMIH